MKTTVSVSSRVFSLFNMPVKCIEITNHPFGKKHCGKMIECDIGWQISDIYYEESQLIETLAIQVDRRFKNDPFSVMSM